MRIENDLGGGLGKSMGVGVYEFGKENGITDLMD
jgi:hypothetical protein